MSGNLAKAVRELLEAVQQELESGCEQCWCDSCGKLVDCPVFCKSDCIRPGPCSSCTAGPMLGRHNGACKYYGKDG